MRKKAKERKQTQVSPDYISAAAGNSGILRDMAGHFAGTGRYVVPTITAACAMQGTVMPVCQVQAAVVTPADSVTIDAGDIMLLPDSGTYTVDGVTINGSGHMAVMSSGMASNTFVNSSGSLGVHGGTVIDTNVFASGSISINSGGVASATLVSGDSFTSRAVMRVANGSAINTKVKNGTMEVSSGGVASDTAVETSGLLRVSSGGVVSGVVVDAGTLQVHGGGEAENVNVSSGGVYAYYGGEINNLSATNTDAEFSSGSIVNNATFSSAYVRITTSAIASGTTINSGTWGLVLSGGAVSYTKVNSGGSVTMEQGLGSYTEISGGNMVVSSDSVVDNTTVNGGGLLNVVSGGEATFTTVDLNGIMRVKVKGSATSTTVSGGSLNVSSGGVATTTTIDLDGTMTVIGGSANSTTLNSGTLAVISGGNVDTTTVSSGGSMTLTGGSATNTNVDSGKLTVSSGGVASSTDIINGGSVTVNGGSVTNTNISSGIMEVISSGLATDTTVYNGGSLSVTGSSTVNNVVLSGGTFTNPTAGSTAFISGTITGDGDITGPGDFTLANGNILLNSGSISTTGTLTLNKVLDTTKPAVSATDFSVGKLDVTDLDTGTSTSGTLIKADTILPAVTLTSGTDSGVLDSISTSVVFGGGAHTDTSIPGFTLDYTAPSATYSLTNSAKEIDYSLNGNKQATKLTFGSIPWKDSGALIDHATQFTDVEFSGADVNTVNIHFNNVASLQANKKMTLVSDFGTSVGTITGTKYTVGTTLQGYGKAELEGNNLVYKVETDSVAISGGGSNKNLTAQEQTHNTLMGMTAGIAVINAGQNFIEQAVDGWGEVRNTGEDGVAVFAAMGASKDRYETGSHIDLNAWNGIVGLGKSHNMENGKLQWGGFLEHGSGKFSLSNAGLTGDGTSTYTGGGMSAKWTNKHDVYTEAGVRYGQIKDSASNILKDVLGNYYGYNVNADYYGGYIGVGKIYRFGENRSLDIYGKFSHIHRDGVSFDAGGRYELDALQSNILRVGAKYGVKSGKVNWYGGLAYEHEFSGEATGKADGLPIRSASIRGGSLRLDLGATIKPSEKSPWTMRMGITGHTGKHRGIGGSLMLSCNF